MIEMKRATGGKLNVPLTQCYISKYVFHSKISSHAPEIYVQMLPSMLQ